jgi:hypothetical protein
LVVEVSRVSTEYGGWERDARTPVLRQHLQKVVGIGWQLTALVVLTPKTLGRGTWLFHTSDCYRKEASEAPGCLRELMYIRMS